jgi:hypothetical protein
VDPRADLDNVEKREFLTLPGLELRPLGRPARSQSLYRLNYPGSYTKMLLPIINSQTISYTLRGALKMAGCTRNRNSVNTYSTFTAESVGVHCRYAHKGFRNWNLHRNSYWLLFTCTVNISSTMSLTKKRICEGQHHDDGDDNYCCYDIVSARTEFFTGRSRNMSRALPNPCIFESVML